MTRNAEQFNYRCQPDNNTKRTPDSRIHIVHALCLLLEIQSINLMADDIIKHMY